jgi:hypothetical protein
MKGNNTNTFKCYLIRYCVLDDITESLDDDSQCAFPAYLDPLRILRRKLNALVEMLPL